MVLLCEILMVINFTIPTAAIIIRKCMLIKPKKVALADWKKGKMISLNHHAVCLHHSTQKLLAHTYTQIRADEEPYLKRWFGAGNGQ